MQNAHFPSYLSTRSQIYRSRKVLCVLLKNRFMVRSYSTLIPLSIPCISRKPGIIGTQAHFSCLFFLLIVKITLFIVGYGKYKYVYYGVWELGMGWGAC